MKTIYILWLRQLKRYMRSRSRIVGAIGTPFLFLVAFGFGFGPVFQKAGGGNYMEFLAPGIIAMGMMFMAVSTGVEIVWDKQFGFLKETLVAPVSRFHIMLGRTLGGATVALLQGLVIFAIAVPIGFRPHPEHLPLGFLFMALTSMVFASLGALIGSALRDMQGFHLIMNLLVQPMFFLSGALFPLSGLPKVVYALAVVNPLSYGVDGIRLTLASGAHFGALTDLFALGVFLAVFLSLGAFAFSRIEA